MDIGVPYRLLGRVDVGPLAERLNALAEEDWIHTEFNRQAIAGRSHGIARAIYLRKEWHPGMHKYVSTDMWDVVKHWSRKWGGDPARVMPFMREDYGGLQVYTFPQMLEWHELVSPILEAALAGLRKAGMRSQVPGKGANKGAAKGSAKGRPAPGGPVWGVLTRATFVKLPAGYVIDEHIDGQAVAALTHRLHVAVTGAECVQYRCDGQAFQVRDGDIFELNNKRPHAVVNRGPADRVNIMLEYFPNPDPPSLGFPRFRQAASQASAPAPAGDAEVPAE
ncbi:MAG TPA: aspartyl/asparaginyl beta-hydroxylase domain-containing protein [Kiloniellales bacterium]|nr:aspartyl/asparaginyl beta-hydroxylase domain-containing protein [Kiloniellales bacterium]